MAFRSLVVVPRSHTDGTFQRLGGSLGSTAKTAVRNPSLVSRAVQLDPRPRPSHPHESALVVWDSRTVHQGHTSGTLPTSARAPVWDPPVFAPKFFNTGDNWRAFLKEEGYAVLSDILPGDAVAQALKLLLEDLQMLSPELRSLDEVREHHLPRSAAANDLRSSAGLCHGNFAWFLRCRPEVTRLFEAMFDLPEGAPLIGSVDVVALAPPGSSKTAGKQWLHLDYTPQQGTIWQACLQLFPRTEKLGSRWERIALMICKAPAAWAAPSVPRMLLAACVTGSASRATAGVTLGKLHREAKETSAARLLPELTVAPQASAQVRAPQSDVDRLRLLTAQEAARRYSAERLRALLPPCRARYVSPEGVFPKVAHNPAKERAARPRASARVEVRPPPAARFMSLLRPAPAPDLGLSGGTERTELEKRAQAKDGRLSSCKRSLVEDPDEESLMSLLFKRRRLDCDVSSVITV